MNKYAIDSAYTQQPRILQNRVAYAERSGTGILGQRITQLCFSVDLLFDMRSVSLRKCRDSRRGRWDNKNSCNP